MHALREFIQERMDTRSWAPADLARESGLSLQLVSQLLNDNREVIANPPKASTVAGLAKAFRVEESSVMRAAFAAMGYQLDQTANVADLSSVPSAQLLRVLADRLGVSEEEYHRGNTATNSRAEVSSATTQPVTGANESNAADDVSATQDDYRIAAQTTGPKTRANRARRQAEKERIPDENQDTGSETGA
ncbi:hypothetical protein [Flexivirga sp.]|uniref:hypothetical protein n=1 Tax=Flexivirga sp. TaxID=1962927 RepID=UPI003F7FD25C